MIDFEQYKALLKADRTVRRFDGAFKIAESTLEKLVDLTRYCASGRNAQPLCYRLVTEAEEREKVYPCLAWAGYYKDWDGPVPTERPTAYIVQCLNTDIAPACLCDDGLQLQAITLGATALGLACCIIKSFNVVKLTQALNLPSNYKPLYVLANGKGVEQVRLEPINAEGDFKYHRDAQGVHYVPKRELKELIIKK